MVKMCDFTDFVTFSNARNDTCSVPRAKREFQQPLGDPKRQFSEQVSLRALLKVTKSVKSHILTISWGLPYWKNSLLAMLVTIPVLKTPFKQQSHTKTLFKRPETVF